MYIIGNRSNEEIIDRTGMYSVPPPASQIAKHFSKKTGIPVSGLYVYMETDKSVQKRILSGDSFNAVWDDIYWKQTDKNGEIVASGYNRNIIDLDFTPEDTKNYLSFSASKKEFKADGQDELLIDVQIKNPKLSVVDFNGTLNVDATTPMGPAKLSFNFTKGLASKSLTTTEAGDWEIPYGTLSEYRIENTIKSVSILWL